ncbi:hypothetical protein NLI96_g6278 [Meripilus lineatus]|uniref:DRBM domain-containing protein n=1 Tax=Meripilus lineatus TaxID=2056292 RepID=A0AAD5V1J7_9APHY|nr:hypothetical protein NLI96_g6278 [Physisporinus lineatus]
MELNNYLQTHGGIGRLRWKEEASGPESKRLWTATAFIDGVEHGKGIDSNKRDAKEIASKEALEFLLKPAKMKRLTKRYRMARLFHFSVFIDILADALEVARRDKYSKSWIAETLSSRSSKSSPALIHEQLHLKFRSHRLRFTRKDMADHHRMNLNKFLQVNGGVNRLDWKINSSGPESSQTWIATAKIDGVEYGRGSASSKAAAKEIAAQQALQALVQA